MKSRVCPYCGAFVEKNKCDYCGQTLPNNFNMAEWISNKKLLKIIFTPYAIVVFLFWTCCCIYNISSIVTDGLGSYIGVSLFGYIFFIAIADTLYYRKHPYKKSASKASIDPPTSSAPRYKFTHSKSFDNMEGHEFEYYCASILEKNGFEGVDVTKGSGDQGIDIIAQKDGVKYGIQCKCYSADIGNKAVQEAFAGKTYYGCHIAAVLTNRYFTKSAKDLAERNGVLLWDRNKLLELIGDPSPSTIPLEQEHVATVEEVRQIMQPHIDSINSYYRNRNK